MKETGMPAASQGIVGDWPLENHGTHGEPEPRVPLVDGNGCATRCALADLLLAHRGTITADWSRRIHQRANLRPSVDWVNTLQVSTGQAIDAVVALLAQDSTSELRTYLNDLCVACQAIGYEIGEIAESLLFLKDSVRSLIGGTQLDNRAHEYALIGELDDIVRWMIGQFSTIYTEAANQRLRQQRECITRMLQLSIHQPETLNIHDVLQSVAQGIIASVNATHCDFYLVDELAHRLIPMQGISLQPQPAERIAAFQSLEPDLSCPGLHRTVLETRKPQVCTHTADQGSTNNALIREMGTRSVLAVPLVARNGVIAIAVTGTFDENRSYTAEQIELAWDVAQIGALVLENARISARRVADQRSIQLGINALLQGLELGEVLTIVCDEARRLTGTQGAAIYLLDDDVKMLQYTLSTGQPPKIVRFPLHNSLSSAAIREGKAFYTNQPADDPRLIRPDLVSCNLIIAPLVARGQPIGMLCAANKAQDLTDEDAKLIQIFADQAAVAIENARLHQASVQNVALQERDRLAREIHDNLAQSLGLLRLQASHVEDLLNEGRSDDATCAAAEMRRTAAEAHSDARETIFSLRNDAATPDDFQTMVLAQQERFRVLHQLQLAADVDREALSALPATSLIQLSRIVQEALANIRKHAQASRARVQVTAEEGQVVATVEDDGQGFDPTRPGATMHGGAGIPIMRERAESVGGSLQVVSNPGRGSRVVVCIPISQ